MQPARAALFGKLPTSLDFVRVNHDSQAAIELDGWAQQALQELLRANASWPALRLRFVFALPEQPQALVGVLAPSRDRAGRKFPVTVLLPWLRGELATRYPAVPAAFSPFFDAAEQLLVDAEQLPREQLAERLEALPVPALADLDGALPQLTAALATGSDEPPAEPAAEAPTDEELRSALRATRDAPAERPQVLDCPIGNEADCSAWLALCRRDLAWRAALPSFFWSEPGAAGRMLIALGAPPTQIPLWFGAQPRPHPRLLRLDGAILAHFTLNYATGAGGIP
jgi:type VI secretion system protein ImpM